MFIDVQDKDLRTFLETGKTKNKALQARKKMQENLSEAVQYLSMAKTPSELAKHKGLNLEKLRGVKAKNAYSVRIDLKYRLEIRIDEVACGTEIVYLCTIITLSNHYK